ncbi:MAG: M28 family metallopeptidase, partial [Hyphomonadaceae bacterium]
MKAFVLGVAAALALAACASADHAAPQSSREPPPPPQLAAYSFPPLSPQAILAHTTELASDAYGGRRPGTRGEDLSVAYIERAYREAGLEPGVTLADGTRTYRQDVPLIAASLRTPPVLTITGRDGARTYAHGTQFTAWTKRLQENVTVENADLLFVGYGVNAPELGWNDYEGVDARGKIVVILINDPDYDTGDDRGFGGRAMTYYGRWTYKYEEAARQGAAGAIIVHQTGPAAYPWAVIETSATGPRFDVVLPDRGMSRAAFEGWMQESVVIETFRRAGLDFAQLRARAQTRGFRAVDLGSLRGSLSLDTEIVEMRSTNVVGVLPGRTHPDEAVIYSSHWDHFGECPPVNGDAICNGALDNASGTAGLIELGRRAASDGRAARSMVFLAVTAEEQGLLGSLYYAQHPTFPANHMVGVINMDGMNYIGPTRDVEVVGLGKSEMDALVTAAAEAQGRRIVADAFPERGSFYRSDQLSFARIGVPVLYARSGIDLVNGGVARGRALSEDYVANRYHKPDDEVTPAWDLTGGAQDLQMLYAVGRNL